jgi:hypothetical protein
VSDWIDRHTRRAPAALAACVQRHVEAVDASGSQAQVLARAGRHALQFVAGHPEGDRSIALDLLAADALITLALLSQAQEAPGALEAFASSLLHDPPGTP